MSRKEQCGLIAGRKFSPELLKLSSTKGFIHKAITQVSLPPDQLSTDLHYEVDDITHYETILAFAADLDVLYIHDINVDLNALEEIEKAGVKVYPNVSTLRKIEDRNRELLAQQLNYAFHDLKIKTYNISVCNFPNSPTLAIGEAWNLATDEALYTDVTTCPEGLDQSDAVHMVQTVTSVVKAENFTGLLNFELGLLENGSIQILHISPGLAIHESSSGEYAFKRKGGLEIAYSGLEPNASKKATQSLAMSLLFGRNNASDDKTIITTELVTRCKAAVKLIQDISTVSVADYWLTVKQHKTAAMTTLPPAILQHKYQPKTLHL